MPRGCRGPIMDMLHAVSDIVDFDYVPFGNANFILPECGDDIFCWTTTCSVANPPAECFKGKLACQHGEEECYGNLIETCAKNATAQNPLKYMPFVNCYEGEGDVSRANMEACAKKHNLDAADLQACAAGSRGQALIAKEARKTVIVPGRTTEAYVPMAWVAGEVLSDIGTMLRAVCRAYTGPKPAAC
eukprot:TRINITY_DN446_c0_g3_i4.p1 TRINITY_DN446_c0_g3~~TRINITY_DN446_c0_g3_i4.p1  ORF type:complete len:188 (+),score=86.73 TRINITY_DN446_c0_g3_i4:145-708(+)